MYDPVLTQWPNLEVTRSKVKVTGVMVKSQNCNIASKMYTVWRFEIQFDIHVACDEFCIPTMAKVIRSKAKLTEVMAARGAFWYTNTSFNWIKNYKWCKWRFMMHI